MHEGRRQPREGLQQKGADDGEHKLFRVKYSHETGSVTVESTNQRPALLMFRASQRSSSLRMFAPEHPGEMHLLDVA